MHEFSFYMADDTFLVADSNGDHHDDWICHHKDGTVCVRYNSFKFGGTTTKVIDLDIRYILEKYSVLAYLTHVMIKLKKLNLMFFMFFRSEHVRDGDV